MSRMSPIAARSFHPASEEPMPERRRRERRGQGDELAARLFEAFLNDRRVEQRRRSSS